MTPRCNFNCVHCYLQDHHAEDFLSKDDVIQMLDLLYDEGILFLTLTGGEVLTRKDFAEIYAYAKRKGFLMEVFTNGYALTEEVIALFNSCHRCWWIFRCMAPARKPIKKSPA